MKSLKAVCPHCKEGLTDSDHLISGVPGIWVEVRVGKEKGTIWLSSRLGDCQIDSGDIVISEGEVVTFYCPHCDKKISNGGDSECGACQSSMVFFEFVVGAQVCSKRGCSGYAIAGAPGDTAGPPGGSFFW
ncbi:MAG: hypothetical protein HQ538_04340 [Parcubacteria group bacterium]|nr:hypothetical protein [Parcubacteria group bacterium]